METLQNTYFFRRLAISRQRGLISEETVRRASMLTSEPDLKVESRGSYGLCPVDDGERISKVRRRVWLSAYTPWAP